MSQKGINFNSFKSLTFLKWVAFEPTRPNLKLEISNFSEDAQVRILKVDLAKFLQVGMVLCSLCRQYGGLHAESV